MAHHRARVFAGSLVLLAFLLAPGAVPAQPAFRVEDVNTTASKGTGHYPADQVLFSSTKAVDGDGIAFLGLGDGIHGVELWRSDGTAAGTRLVKDICPGVCSSAPHHLTMAGDTLFFIADDGVRGPTLWKSDGTEAGTAFVKRVDLNPWWDRVTAVVGLGQDLAIFVVNVNAFNHQIWKSDGTEAGTNYVATFGRINDNTPLNPIARLGGSLLFEVGDPAGQYGRELWKTDGTLAGTVLVKDIVPGSSSAFPSNGLPPVASAAVGGRVFFAASGGLWASDGTEAGTVLVKQLGFGNSNTANFTALGNAVYFPASDTFGLELWKSDGTEDGTVRITDFASGNIRHVTASGGQVFFLYDDGTHGLELWKTDGTGAGTVLVKDIWPGSSSGIQESTAALTDVEGTLVFFADDGVHGNEPWKSDGTEAGTSMLADLHPGPPSSFQRAGSDIRTVAGGRLYFRAESPGAGLELSITDGTPAGTFLLPVAVQTSAFELLPTGELKGPRPMFDLGGTLLFQAGAGGTGAELWRSDSTEAGTFQLQNLDGSPVSSFPHEFTLAGGTLFFRAGRFDAFPMSTPLVSGLWKTDGTQAGTVPLSWFLFSNEDPYELTTAGGKLFFVADEPGGHDEVLWTSDGTSAGTVPIQDGSTDVANWPRDLKAFGNRVFFSSDGPVQDEELWASDGTNAGTVLVKDLQPGPFSISRPAHFEALGGTLFFTADTNVIRRELWKTDGTEAGTVLVEDIGPGSSFPDSLNDTERRLAAAGSILFFSTEEFPGSSLWKSDGTAPGTVPLKDFNHSVRSLTAVGSRVYFTVEDAQGGELWVSDGTVTGTRKVEDILPGSGSSAPQQLTTLGHILLFTATDGVHGRELWRSNGQAAGTRQVQDIAPGALSSSPLSFTPAGANVYFAANDNTTGFELWAAPRAALLATFDDVPPSHWAFSQIEALAQYGITSGCGAGAGYCPTGVLSRAEMAVFLGRALHGAGFVPPAATGTRFNDVPAGFWAASWIEQIATDGVTQGCGANPPLFCPASSVTRAEMAVFLLRAKHGGSYTPPPATGTRFTDVPANYWAAAWIEQLAAEGVTQGCVAGRYCPGDLVNRAEMAVFLTRTFGLAAP